MTFCGVWCFLHWSWVLHTCMSKRKASRDHVETACHKLWRGLYLQKASVCSQETGSLSGGERAVCNSISVGAFLILQLLLYDKTGAPCKGNNPYRAVCQLHVWLSCMWAWDLLCYLFLRAKPITVVVWGESDLDCFVSEAIFLPTWASLRFSLVFHRKTLIVPSPPAQPSHSPPAAAQTCIWAKIWFP